MFKKNIRKILDWLIKTKQFNLIKKIIIRTFSYFNINFIFYNEPNRIKILELIERIKKENELGLTNIEAYQLYVTVKKAQKIIGDIAEVGVWKGGSAKLICETKGDRSLHLFDTFEGLPNLSRIDDSKQFLKEQYASSLNEVENYLKKYHNVYYYKGYFPSTATSIKNKIFSFVHLDTDLYESTLNCLNFFYPRMEKGGVILSHDYTSVIGVRKAFEEFFSKKSELIIELFTSQCLIVKL